MKTYPVIIVREGKQNEFCSEDCPFHRADFLSCNLFKDNVYRIYTKENEGKITPCNQCDSYVKNMNKA